MTNINDFMKNFNVGGQISFGNTSEENVTTNNIEEVNPTSSNTSESQEASNKALSNSQISNQVVNTELQPENHLEEQPLNNTTATTNTVVDDTISSSTENTTSEDVSATQQNGSSDDILFAMIESNTAEGTNKNKKTSKSSSKPAQSKPKVPHYNAAQEYDVYWASRHLFTLPEELPEVPANEIIPYIRKKIVEEFHYDQAKDSQYFEIVISDSLRANPVTNEAMPCYVCQLAKGTTQRKG